MSLILATGSFITPIWSGVAARPVPSRDQRSQRRSRCPPRCPRRVVKPYLSPHHMSTGSAAAPRHAKRSAPHRPFPLPTLGRLPNRQDAYDARNGARQQTYLLPKTLASCVCCSVPAFVLGISSVARNPRRYPCVRSCFAQAGGTGDSYIRAHTSFGSGSFSGCVSIGEQAVSC